MVSSLKVVPRWKKVLGILLLLCLIVIGFYLFEGVNSDTIGYFITKRLSKIITIIVVSLSVGYSSLIFQTITNNRILTPSIMGLESLYLCIQTMIVYFFGSANLTMMKGQSNYFLSIVSMMLVSFLLFRLLFKKEQHSIYFLILSGMVLGSLFGGLSSFMQVLLDPNEFLILQGKMFASFHNINVGLLQISILIIMFTLFFNRKNMKTLDVLSLGRQYAINLGVNYHQMIKKQFLIISVLTAVSTALVGPITFLGILVVSVVRKLMNSYQHPRLMVGVTLFGTLLLTIGLYVVERVFNFNTTLSVIVNFVGGIYFIYLIIKENTR